MAYVKSSQSYVPAEFFDKNSGVITVTSAGISLVTLNLGSVVAGDRIEVHARMSYTKGLTGGRDTLQIIRESGTGDFVVYSNLPSSTGVRESNSDTPASGIVNITLTAILRVTVSGTLSLGLYGYSAGSDSSLAADQAQIYALVFRL